MIDEQGEPSPVRVFYLSADEDEKLRSDLERRLSLLRRQGFITDWHRSKVSPGVDWFNESMIELERAQIILVLMSPDLVASEVYDSPEMKRAIERQKAGEARVIPVLLRPGYYEGVPFEPSQGLPSTGQAITQWADRDEAYADVARGIGAALKELKPEWIAHSPVSIQEQESTTCPELWMVPYRRNRFFTGREDLLAHLHEQLHKTTATALMQTLSLNGLGGIGKTQVAVEYAYRYQNEYRVVLWVNAATHATLIADFLKLADVLNVPERNAGDHSLTIAAVKRWLMHHDHWLLIVDNADDVAMVDAFLPDGGNTNGYVLLTTRDQVSWAIANSIEVEEMEPAEGLLLLLHRAGILSPGAPLEQASSTDRRHAEAIVTELGGIPLALDQAGAYIQETQCSLMEYLTLYRMRRKELLRWRSRSPSDHPEPVATTWSLSFQAIEETNPAAAELLRLCAFLAPDAIPEELFTRGAPDLGEIFSPVAADLLALNEALRVILRYSLLRRRAETRTLSIHRLVQAVLVDDMDEKLQRRWAERAVRAVNRIFPSVGMTTWSSCSHLLPHAVVCADLIDRYQMNLPEAARLLNQAGSYLRARAQYTEAEQLLQRALRIWEQVLGPIHSNTALGLNNLAEIYHAQSRYALAEPLLQRALAIWEQVLGPSHPDTAGVLNNLGMLYYAQGRYREAEPLLQRALAIREQMLGPSHPETADSLNNLAALYYAQGRNKEVEPLLQRALAIREQAQGPHHPDTADSLNNLARLYHTQGRYREAEPLLQRALAIYERVEGPEHPDTASGINNLAELYHAQGRNTEAEPLLQRALAIYERVEGPEHPDTASALNNLGMLFCARSKEAEAAPLLQRAQAIREKVQGPQHPDTMLSLSNLAVLYYTQNKDMEAEPLLQRALAVREQVLGPSHPDTALALNNLAGLYFAQGKEVEAEALYERALAIREDVLGHTHPDTVLSLSNLAELYRVQGKYELAEPLLQRVLAINEQVLDLTHPNIARSLSNLAMLCQAQGKRQQAAAFYKRALTIYEQALGLDHPQTRTIVEYHARLLEQRWSKKLMSIWRHLLAWLWH